jgi:hypothetical protein
MAIENWQQPAIGATAAFLGSIPQMVEARRLRKERERLLKEGAPGLTPIEQEQMAAARARAASALAPGYAQEMEGIAQQQADVLAAGRRGSATGSNLLNLLSRMNAQGQAARRNLAMRGAQAQRQAQGELTSLSMSADARRENRMRRYEDDLAAMDAARRQYNAAAGMAPLQGALAFMPVEGLKFGKSATTPTPESVRFNPETDMQLGEEMGVANTRKAVAPTGESIGLGSQLGANEAIKYNPYKTPSLRRYPTTEAMYQNMFNPDAAFQRRMKMSRESKTILPPRKEYADPTGLEREIPQVNLRVDRRYYNPPTAGNNMYSY